MRKILGHFRTTGVRLIQVDQTNWHIDLWDHNHADRDPFATKDVTCDDPKAAAVMFIAEVFEEKERHVRRDLEWKADFYE